MKKVVLIGFLVLSFVLAGWPLPTAAIAQGPLELEGTLHGAPYKIRVPSNWNGTLLVFAHGYTRRLEAAPGGTPVENALLARGYALAGSAYLTDGWAVKEGIADTLALVSFFKGRVGEPQYTILWGTSMGSVVTFKSVEDYPNVYDGVIPGCGLGAGTPRNFDLTGAIALAYDVAFGWPSAWGKPEDVRDDLNFQRDVLPVLVAQVRDRANFGRFEFIRLILGGPAEDFYTGSNWLFQDFFFVTEARAELERRAGGPVVQNLDHVYRLTDQEKAYLATLGVDADSLLAQMNARRNFSPPAKARRYLENYAEYTGQITRPVLTLHTRIDGLVLPANMSAYRETVRQAGREGNLLQVYTDSVGHCTFTIEQLVAVAEAMDSWVRTGVRPSASAFPEALGFLPDFVPPPWPQP